MDARDRFFLGWFLAAMGLNALAAERVLHELSCLASFY